jgi:hypothetical protein
VVTDSGVLEQELSDQLQVSNGFIVVHNVSLAQAPARVQHMSGTRQHPVSVPKYLKTHTVGMSGPCKSVLRKNSNLQKQPISRFNSLSEKDIKRH